VPHIKAKSIKPQRQDSLAHTIEAVSGGIIADGAIVKVSGYSNGRPIVEMAQSSDASFFDTTYFVALHGVLTGELIRVAAWRILQGIDTSSVSVGAAVFLSTTLGEYTLGTIDADAGLLIRQPVGHVLVSDATAGVVFLNPGANYGNLVTGNNCAAANSLPAAATVESAPTQLYRINVPNSSGVHATIVTGNRFLIIDTWAIKQGAAGGAADQVRIEDDLTNLISAVPLNGVNNLDVARTAAVDHNISGLAKASTFVISSSKTTDCSCQFFILGVRF
jgi:hypothetical protein